MIQLLMLLATFSPIQLDATIAKGFTPCVWPNPCGVTETVEVATKYEICVWPRKCAAQPEEPVQVAQIQPCVWPNPCNGVAKEEPKLIAGISTCQWPNPCSAREENV
jgi:hypothetical protein